MICYGFPFTNSQGNADKIVNINMYGYDTDYLFYLMVDPGKLELKINIG